MTNKKLLNKLKARTDSIKEILKEYQRISAKDVEEAYNETKEAYLNESKAPTNTEDTLDTFNDKLTIIIDQLRQANRESNKDKNNKVVSDGKGGFFFNNRRYAKGKTYYDYLFIPETYDEYVDVYLYELNAHPDEYILDFEDALESLGKVLCDKLNNALPNSKELISCFPPFKYRTDCIAGTLVLEVLLSEAKEFIMFDVKKHGWFLKHALVENFINTHSID